MKWACAHYARRPHINRGRSCAAPLLVPAPGELTGSASGTVARATDAAAVATATRCRRPARPSATADQRPAKMPQTYVCTLRSNLPSFIIHRNNFVVYGAGGWRVGLFAGGTGKSIWDTIWNMTSNKQTWKRYCRNVSACHEHELRKRHSKDVDSKCSRWNLKPIRVIRIGWGTIVLLRSIHQSLKR